KRVLADGPQPLHEFRTLIRDDASANATTYQSFRSRAIAAVKRQSLLDYTGSRVAGLVILGVILLVVGSFFILPRVMGDQVTGATTPVLVLFGLVIGVILLIVILAFRKVRVKRTPEGALEAARWEAFRA